jgi:benzodiazapine receptor
MSRGFLFLSLLLFILAFEGVSFAIGTVTQGSIDGWYAGLTRPPLVPLNIVFPIMWSLLYALIAAAAWLLWRNRKDDSSKAGALKTPIILFVVYMALNWSWTFVFFGAHQLLLGLIWIAALNVIALVFILRTLKPCRAAALLMIPPTLWTFFAMYLNGGFWWLNG